MTPTQSSPTDEELVDAVMNAAEAWCKSYDGAASFHDRSELWAKAGIARAALLSRLAELRAKGRE
jgi:hypothetical protein